MCTVYPFVGLATCLIPLLNWPQMVTGRKKVLLLATLIVAEECVSVSV